MRNNTLLGFMVGLLVACGSSVVASSGPTLDQFNTLQAQVTALSSEVDTIKRAADGTGVFVAATTTGSTIHFAQATSVTTGTSIGTFAGTDTQTITNATAFLVRSADGYLFQLPAEGGTAGPAADFLGDVLFETFDCSGQGYLRGSATPGLGISNYAAHQGVVTRIGSDATSAASYAAVAPDTVQTLVNFNSRLTGPGTCDVTSGAQFGYALIVNDELVTGVKSGNYPSDLTLGPTG